MLWRVWFNDFLRALAELVRASAWPLVAIILLIRYRDRLGELITRLRELFGAKFDPPAQAQATTEAGTPAQQVERLAHRAADGDGQPAAPAAAGGLPTWVQTARTPFVLRVENTVATNADIQAIVDPAIKAQALLTLGTLAVIGLTFEKVEGSIWASQLRLLELLNATPGGMMRDQVKTQFYDSAARQFPQWYQNYSFTDYMNFLASFWLIHDGDVVTIREDGREYLVWRVRAGKTPKAWG